MLQNTELTSSQQKNTRLPTIVKQIFLLVMPNNNGSDSEQQDSYSVQHSPFEQTYFSFPALEEVDGSCGQHHQKQSPSIKETNDMLF
jgi:hypothetical protein